MVTVPITNTNTPTLLQFFSEKLNRSPSKEISVEINYPTIEANDFAS